MDWIPTALMVIGIGIGACGLLVVTVLPLIGLLGGGETEGDEEDEG